jgi:hypothetical protein
LEVVSYGWDGAFEEGREEVNGICIDAGAFVVSSMSDGVAYVTRKGICLVILKSRRVWIA